MATALGPEWPRLRCFPRNWHSDTAGSDFLFRLGASGILPSTQLSSERCTGRYCAVKTDSFVSSLVRKGERPIRSAHLNLRDGDPDSAVNRSYYAMFNVARAALLSAGLPEGQLPRAHRGLIEAFRTHAVQTGRIDPVFKTNICTAHNSCSAGGTIVPHGQIDVRGTSAQSAMAGRLDRTRSFREPGRGLVKGGTMFANNLSAFSFRPSMDDPGSGNPLDALQDARATRGLEGVISRRGCQHARQCDLRWN